MRKNGVLLTAFVAVAVQPVVLGADDSFQVLTPYGKELVFAVLFDKPSAVLTGLWSQNRIGDPESLSFDPQERFLEALGAELTAAGGTSEVFDLNPTLVGLRSKTSLV